MFVPSTEEHFMRFAALILGATCALTTVSTAYADTLLVKRMNHENAAAMPRRGSTMSSVEAQYGAPMKKYAAVGKPPITRWDYPAFSVYFEYKHVIDAVASKASETEMGAKPVPQQNKPAE
jgi:hypothetical protein